MNSDEIRAAVNEYSGWACTDKSDDIIHVRRYNNQVDAACGNVYPKWRYFPIIALNEGEYSWCDDCMTAVEEHNESDEGGGLEAAEWRA